ILRPFARGLEYSTLMVFPSENLHCADAGGLGRLFLSCWAVAERVKTRIGRNARVIFLRIKFSLKKNRRLAPRCESAKFRAAYAKARLDYLGMANVSNARAEDLWASQAKTAKLPVSPRTPAPMPRQRSDR